jgi:hypothetical protein
LIITKARLKNYSAILLNPVSTKYSVLVNKKFLTEKGSFGDGIVFGVFGPLVWAVLGAQILLLFFGMVLSGKLRFSVFRKQHTWNSVMSDICIGQMTTSFSEYLHQLTMKCKNHMKRIKRKW